ncbi:MAG: TIGR01777 family protein [Pyrinomonadaceae bacterium]|nr:TIGR01777 family protein [Pyrinomonadaceae bacterium]
MKILVSGASGLVGNAVVGRLSSRGAHVLRLVRKPSPDQSSEILWNPQKGIEAAGKLEGLDAVIHLAGEPIAEGRWTEDKKRRIRESRVVGTKILAEALAGLERKPSAFLSASAIGYYGSRGSEILTEESRPGDDFLAEVCREWEEATTPAARAGIRTVQMRFGIILSSKGGALTKMLMPFKLGIGGRLGSGEQYMSWIAIDDVVGVVEHLLDTDSLSGPVNTVAPSPVTNREFTKALGDVLSRPTIFPVPKFAMRLAFGEMADVALLASQRVEPARLKASGYVFKYPELKEALRHILKE